MAVSTKLSVAVHILTLIGSKEATQVNSEFIAGSIHTNPVVVRRYMSALKKAGLIESSRGATKTSLTREPSQISLYDVYQALALKNDLFNIHQDTNIECLIGRNIQTALEREYRKIQEKMEEDLKKVTLQDVLEDIIEINES
ncbi:Rrf2 family transcriptional regulator [Vagococcus entomophilus]|uniref:Transcriptional regulator n=1 Tax=Vagococcus entomophilus TaxID=1160095 RepID=A0A430AHY3_9ENTE|nr:Rrf2 family transcriptional regulator [Vagococcus entomophilus]RSU07377.1 transcriptional regulator [Vagococcus entomophilus]